MWAWAKEVFANVHDLPERVAWHPRHLEGNPIIRRCADSFQLTLPCFRSQHNLVVPYDSSVCGVCGVRLERALVLYSQGSRPFYCGHAVPLLVVRSDYQKTDRTVTCRFG